MMDNNNEKARYDRPISTTPVHTFHIKYWDSQLRKAVYFTLDKEFGL